MTMTNPRVTVCLQNLIDLASAGASLRLFRHQRLASQTGNYVSRVKGRGMEFDETRLYQAGDDIRTIDWRVTARTGKPHTKVFREERERPVFISVDQRAAMHFATRGVFKSVQAAKLAGLLAWAAEHHGDRIGGQIFNETMCLELKPHSGKHAVLRLLNALATPKPNGLALSYEQVLARLNQHARPGSLVYLISDFRGINAQVEAYLAKLARHCELVLIFVYDALEAQLPDKGQYRFANDEREVFVDAGNHQGLSTYRQRFQARQEQLQALARLHNMRFVLCDTHADPIRCLAAA